jgi:hypothetical protein
MNASNLSSKNTHDLWVEARQFSVEIARPTPTTITLKVSYPTALTVADGALVLLSTKPITVVNYPVDGTPYVGSTDFAAPADKIGDAHVISLYSAIQSAPLPADVIDNTTGTTSFTITIQNTVQTELYYGSVHAASNVLQYYPIGVQSYPLADPVIESNRSPFAGNVPSLPSAPLAPTVGMVYHDQQTNLMQYWTGSVWIPTRSDTILTGETNPGIQGQVYILGGASLMAFNGTSWVQCTATNLLFRDNLGVFNAPLSGVQSRTSLPDAPTLGLFVWNYTTNRGQYWDGAAWVVPSPTNALLNIGAGSVPAFTTPITLEPAALADPFIGELFYNTTSKCLNAWTGSTWRKVNTDQQGVPSPDKIAIGDDGSYEARQRLIGVLKHQLGWPTSCIELKEEHFNIAIDNALDNYRMWCDGAYRMAYVMYPLIPNQQTYYLNSQTDGTDKIVEVSKIHRLNVLGIETANGNDAIWSSGILTSYYSAATVDILSLHLLSSLSEEFQRLFAGDLTFLWNEGTRELLITRKVYRSEKVIIECRMEKTEQEILRDRWSKQFIQNWALAENKYQLGLIRSRFTSGTPGAAGTITQNGELLIAEANTDFAELKQSALDYEWGGMIGGGNQSFLIG